MLDASPWQQRHDACCVGRAICFSHVPPLLVLKLDNARVCNMNTSMKALITIDFATLVPSASDRSIWIESVHRLCLLINEFDH
jgi:hypothetical protein